MEIGMSQISIGKCIRCSLEPDYHGVHLAESANQRMMDVEVNNVGCGKQEEGRIDAMEPGYQFPRGLEPFSVVFCRSGSTLELFVCYTGHLCSFRSS